MVKDRMGYRSSRKHAQSSDDFEKSIGITALRYSKDGGRAVRPVGLMKWSFDDFIVEEQLPGGLVHSSRANETGKEEATAACASTQEDNSLLVRVLSEGVPDTVIENLFQQRLSRRVAVHFLTPVDFLSSSTRHVWIRANTPELRAAFARPLMIRTREGEVHLSAATVIAVPASSTAFPLHLLPNLRFTVVLRDIAGSLADVLPPLQQMLDSTGASSGVLNYYHIACHGLSTFRAFEDGKRLLQRDYVPMLQHYSQCLSEGTPGLRREIPTLLDTLADRHSSPRDWEGVMQGLTAALSEDREVMRLPQTGLYAPHHALLNDFVTRASDLHPRTHDSAQLLRESVSRLVMQEKMRAVSGVAFNALASLRWEMYGAKVQVGDLVVDNATTTVDADESVPIMRDVFEGAADHINGAMISSAHREWVSLADDAITASHARVRVVKTQAEADQHSIDQVVLPFYGRGVNALPVLPDNRCGPIFQRLSRELQIDGLPQMKTSPLASYRHLIAAPRDVGVYIFDEKRGWDWVEGEQHGEALKAAIYKDQEGIHRVQSPFMTTTKRNMIARRGIRREENRNFFLKPARRPGMTCALAFTLPRGTPATSSLREAFRVATISSSRIAQTLRR